MAGLTFTATVGPNGAPTMKPPLSMNQLPAISTEIPGSHLSGSIQRVGSGRHHHAGRLDRVRHGCDYPRDLVRPVSKVPRESLLGRRSPGRGPPATIPGKATAAWAWAARPRRIWPMVPIRSIHTPGAASSGMGMTSISSAAMTARIGFGCRPRRSLKPKTRRIWRLPSMSGRNSVPRKRQHFERVRPRPVSGSIPPLRQHLGHAADGGLPDLQHWHEVRRGPPARRRGKFPGQD